MLANRSKLKSDNLKAIEDGARELHAKDAQIKAKRHKNIKLQRQFDAIKFERTREIWLLNKEIENLAENNKSLAKTHQGNYSSTALFSLMCPNSIH